jgi:acyl-CoA synthetase (AMP-forming)/AMP-acid ligase II
VPDPIYGEEVVSYVVARPGAALDAEVVLRACAAALPAFKAPKQVVLATSLPKTERGKLDRRALVERWNREAAASIPSLHPGCASARPSASLSGEGARAEAEPSEGG